MRIYTTFGKLITSFKECTISDLDSGTVRDEVSFCLTCLRASNDDLTFFLCIFNSSNTSKLCDDSKSFRFSCLKKLLNTRKTLCDIITGNTTGVESTHCKLCTRLTDRLSSDNTNCLTNLYCLTGCHVCTVAFCTNTDFRTAGKNCTDFYFLKRFSVLIYTFAHNQSCTFRCDHMICCNKYVSVCIVNIFTCKTSCDTLLEALDFLFAIHECTYVHTSSLTSIFTAICLTNDQIL